MATSDRWPTGSGFECFCGFGGGETHRYYAELTPRPTDIPAWDDMPDDLKPAPASLHEAPAPLASGAPAGGRERHLGGQRVGRLDAGQQPRREKYAVESGAPIPAGTREVRMEFRYDGDGVGKGGTATLRLDGQKVGEGRVEKTWRRPARL